MHQGMLCKAIIKLGLRGRLWLKIGQYRMKTQKLDVAI